MLTKPLTHWILLLFLLSGCTALPPGNQLPSTNTPPKSSGNTPVKVVQSPAIQNVKQLEKQGNYAEAAKEYLNLSRQVLPPARQQYQLAAVENLIKAGKLGEARAEVKRIDTKQGFGLQIPLELIEIRFLLAERRTDQALDRLDNLKSSVNLPNALRIQYHQLRGQALEISGNVIEATRERLLLDSLLNSDAQALNENHQTIWRGLSNVGASVLAQVQQTPGDVLSGWVALALLAKNSTRLSQDVGAWQQRYPNHPAREIAQGLVQPTATAAVVRSSAKEVALLLPLSGNFSAQAEAIRDGFLAAWYAEGVGAPHVTVHDANSKNINRVYQEVVNAGASFVVGPLEKEALSKLLQNQPQLPVSTLSLNYLESGAAGAENFYQFGLSPEDEARDVANRAWEDGHRIAAALVPKDPWGERVLKAFRSEWQKRGGQLITSQAYTEDVSSAVNRVFKEGGSADVIFMAAVPKFARQLIPFLKRQTQGQVPVYSTSHVYSGTPDPRRDQDMDGVVFGDMPWRLAPDMNAIKLQNTLQQYWPDGMSDFKHLYALGVDAYRVLGQLNRLATQSGLQWQGHTGRLSLDNSGAIRRQLMWAKFVNGKPQVITYSP